MTVDLSAIYRPIYRPTCQISSFIGHISATDSISAMKDAEMCKLFVASACVRLSCARKHRRRHGLTWAPARDFWVVGSWDDFFRERWPQLTPRECEATQRWILWLEEFDPPPIEDASLSLSRAYDTIDLLAHQTGATRMAAWSRK